MVGLICTVAQHRYGADLNLLLVPLVKCWRFCRPRRAKACLYIVYRYLQLHSIVSLQSVPLLFFGVANCEESMVTLVMNQKKKKASCFT